jgi:putative restriction endonuclease
VRIVLSDEAEREEAQSLIRDVSVPATLQTSDDLDYWEHKIESGIESDVSINPTDREAIIRARRGQGLFKQRVMEIEHGCRITGSRTLFI